MNLSEFCKLKRDNAHLSEEEFAIKAYNLQRQSIKDAIFSQKEDKIKNIAEQQIEKQLDKNLDKAIERALISGTSTINIDLNI